MPADIWAHYESYARYGRLCNVEGQPIVWIARRELGRRIRVRLPPSNYGPVRLPDGRRLIGSVSLWIPKSEVKYIALGALLSDL